LLQLAVIVPPSEHAVSTTVHVSFSFFLPHSVIQAWGRKVDFPRVVTLAGAPVQFAGGRAAQLLVTFVHTGTIVAFVADAGRYEHTAETFPDDGHTTDVAHVAPRKIPKHLFFQSPASNAALISVGKA
jgi:hypothetical protein